LACNSGSFPGTSERICLITGNLESIMKVVKFIMDKIRDRPDMPYDRSAAEDVQVPFCYYFRFSQL
jgi:RNA-binding protein Nova